MYDINNSRKTESVSFLYVLKTDDNDFDRFRIA